MRMASSSGDTVSTPGGRIWRRRGATSRSSSSCSRRSPGSHRLRRSREDPMPAVRFPEQRRSLESVAEISDFLRGHGLHYERWPVYPELADRAAPVRVLEAYAGLLEALKARGGYTTADV